MPLEVWIVLALVAAAAVAGIVFRLRRRGKGEAVPARPESNTYPLW